MNLACIAQCSSLEMLCEESTHLAFLVKGGVLSDVQHAGFDELSHLPALRGRQALARPANCRRLIAHLSAPKGFSTNIHNMRPAPPRMTLDALKTRTL